MKAAMVVLVMGALAVGGCGPAVRYEYSKAGATAEQSQRDESECSQQATVTAAGGYSYGPPRHTVDQGRLNRCMTSRGYQVREVKD